MTDVSRRVGVRRWRSKGASVVVCDREKGHGKACEAWLGFAPMASFRVALPCSSVEVPSQKSVSRGSQEDGGEFSQSA